MKKYFFFSGDTSPLQCLICSKPWIEEHPFLICNTCQLMLMRIKDEYPPPQLHIWHSIEKLIFKYAPTKGLVLGVDEGKVMLYLLRKFIWIHLIGIDKSITPSLKKASQRACERVKLIEDPPEESMEFIENNSLDFIFFNKANFDPSFLLWENKLTEKGILIGRYNKKDNLKNHLNKFEVIEDTIWYKLKSESFWSSDDSHRYILDQHLKHDRQDLAHKYFNEHSDISPFIRELQQSKIYYKDGSLSKAFKHAEKARSINIYSKEVTKLFVKLYAACNNYKKASELNALLFKNRENQLFQFDLYRKLKQFDKAKNILDELLLHQEDSFLTFLLASLEQDFGNHKKSHQLYHKGYQMSGSLQLNVVDPYIKTIAMVKTGNKYAPEYVNNLARSAKKFSSIPLRFICFTEDSKGIDPDIEIFDISKYLLDGWWAKLLLFHYDLHKIDEPFLYLDLDQIIIDWIDPLLMVKEPLVILTDVNFLVYNSSVMVINAKKNKMTYDSFIPAFQKNYHGDQDWISDRNQIIKIFPSHWNKSFQNQSNLYPPVGSRIINFHGDLNPHMTPSPWTTLYWKKSNN